MSKLDCNGLQAYKLKVDENRGLDPINSQTFSRARRMIQTYIDRQGYISSDSYFQVQRPWLVLRATACSHEGLSVCKRAGNGSNLGLGIHRLV